MQRIKSFFLFIRKHRDVLFLILTFAVILIVTPNFFTYINLITLIRQISILGIFTMALTAPYIIGDLDLSVAGVAGLTGVIICIFINNGLTAGIAIPLVLVIGIAIGALNGFLVGFIGTEAFVSTLAVLFITNSIELLISGGNIIYAPSTLIWLDQGSVGFIPVPLIISLAILVIFHFFFLYTKSGRYLYIIGDNPEAAKISGVHVVFHKCIAFMISGFLSAIVGIILVSHSNSAQVLGGNKFLLEGITAYFLGLLLLPVGEKPLFTTSFIGAVLLTVITNIFLLNGVNYFYIDFLKGFILILAVSVNFLKNHYYKRKKRVI